MVGASDISSWNVQRKGETTERGSIVTNAQNMLTSFAPTDRKRTYSSTAACISGYGEVMSESWVGDHISLSATPLSRAMPPPNLRRRRGSIPWFKNVHEKCSS